MNTPASNAVSSVGASQPDYIAIAMVAIMALIVIIMVIRKHLHFKKRAESALAEAAVTETAAPVPSPAAPGSAGEIKLHDVEPRTAAMLMAIVADDTGIPLNELRFISIKEIK